MRKNHADIEIPIAEIMLATELLITDTNDIAITKSGNAINISHNKRMIKWLIEYYTGIEKDLTPNKREYIEMILTYTLNTHYSIYCEYDKDHKRAYNEIREFDDYLKKTNQRLYDRLNCMAYVRYNRETQFKFVKVDGSKWHKVMVLARKVKGRFAR